MSASLLHQESPLFDSPFATPTDPSRSRLFLGLITALAVLALCLSVYLTWTTWSSGTPAGCTADGIMDCDAVLASAKSGQWVNVE